VPPAAPESARATAVRASSSALLRASAEFSTPTPRTTSWSRTYTCANPASGGDQATAASPSPRRVRLGVVRGKVGLDRLQGLLTVRARGVSRRRRLDHENTECGACAVPGDEAAVILHRQGMRDVPHHDVVDISPLAARLSGTRRTRALFAELSAPRKTREVDEWLEAGWSTVPGDWNQPPPAVEPARVLRSVPGRQASGAKE
jgi:hypothetical protein